MDDTSETAEEWWTRNEPHWRRNPPYYEHVLDKARKNGKEWVRKHKTPIDRAWDYRVISDAYDDAPYPEGYERHAAWSVERLEERARAGQSASSRGYFLWALEVFGPALLLTNEEFERALAEGRPIPDVQRG